MNVKQKHSSIIRITVFIALFLVLILGATYAVMLNISYNTENVSAMLGSRPVFTSTATNNIVMNNIPYIGEESETEYEIANGTDNLSIALSSGYTINTSCSYDIVWEWDLLEDPANGYYKTAGATKEFTVSGTSLTGNQLVEAQVNDYDPNNLKTILGTGVISATGTTMSNDTWTFTTHFYKTQAIQYGHQGKSYPGRIYLDNVLCHKTTLADYLIATAPKSGTDAVANSPWILTSDHPGEYRYAGKNPDNYIQFNGELWRIIGVMPNMTYCTGEYGTETECDTTKTGSLVKIIRNQVISSSTLRWDYKLTGVGSSTSNYGSNDWSDSQLMLMLNGTNYLKTGYDVNNNKLHNSYTITSNVVAGNGYNFYNATYSYLDGNGTTVNIPSSAGTSSYTYTATSGTLYKKIESSALNQIATVKWDLYGTDTYQTAAEGSPSALYNKERNINGLGAVYTGTTPENRPVYWYGKVGLMYPSDYGYATNGGTTYDRNTCLGYQMNGWDSGDYKTDCALNSYLLFQNITSTAPGTIGTPQWTLSPSSGVASSVFYIFSAGYVNLANAVNPLGFRPVLYLKADTMIAGGTGTYNNPYTLDFDEINTYWFNTSSFAYPDHPATTYSSGSSTNHDVYIGQDSNKYYACLNSDGAEACVSQPYTQYGLEDHIPGMNFSSEQQARAKQAIYRVFYDADIDISLNNDCTSYSQYIDCKAGDLGVFISYKGFIETYDNSTDDDCDILYSGRAICYVDDD